MALEARRAELERQIRVGLEPPGAGSPRRARARAAPALGLRVHPAARHARSRRSGPDGQAQRSASPRFSSASPSGCVALLARAVQLQIIDGEQVGERGREHAHRAAGCSPARRGALYDRNGVPLAITQEFYHVGIAPNELRRSRRGVPAHRPQPRRPGGPARSRVPREQALDLPARPVQRDPGPAAARDQRGAPRGRIPAVLSLARAGASDHRRARGRSRRRRSRPRAGAGLDPHRHARGGGAAEGPGGTPLRLARRAWCATRCPATTSCSPSTRSFRRSPSAGWPMRWRR